MLGPVSSSQGDPDAAAVPQSYDDNNKSISSPWSGTMAPAPMALAPATVDNPSWGTHKANVVDTVIKNNKKDNADHSNNANNNKADNSMDSYDATTTTSNKDAVVPTTYLDDLLTPNDGKNDEHSDDTNSNNDDLDDMLFDVIQVGSNAFFSWYEAMVARAMDMNRLQRITSIAQRNRLGS